MKTAIIIHGMPSKEEYFDVNGASQSNKHWIPWIQKHLILNNTLTHPFTTFVSPSVSFLMTGKCFLLLTGK